MSSAPSVTTGTPESAARSAGASPGRARPARRVSAALDTATTRASPGPPPASLPPPPPPSCSTIAAPRCESRCASSTAALATPSRVLAPAPSDRLDVARVEPHGPGGARPVRAAQQVERVLEVGGQGDRLPGEPEPRERGEREARRHYEAPRGRKQRPAVRLQRGRDDGGE